MLTVCEALCSAGHCREFRAEKDTRASLKCQILMFFLSRLQKYGQRTNALISKHAPFVLDERGIAVSPHSSQLPLLCSYTNMSGTYLYLPGNSDSSIFPLVRKAFGKVKGLY